MDQIISCQISINGIVLPICICFLCGLQWMKDLSYFISKKGCYVGPFIVNFTGSYFCCHSFFISLFRYICILHPEKTFRLGLNAPKVSILFLTIVLGNLIILNICFDFFRQAQLKKSKQIFKICHVHPSISYQGH